MSGFFTRVRRPFSVEATTGPDGTLFDSSVEIRLHRRRQTVVVRAGESQGEIPLASVPGRRRMRTLIGLDQRERFDTLWDEDDASVEAVADSSRRPVVLVDGVDDDLAEEYRAEAERILREGRLGRAG